ncbi:MAG: thioesterase family protein [Syntrophobacterales bacterium]|jgi:acyl-CoA thioesterase FadM|nr:thioesterase family protein [Syntrophobacterales bacterium]
MPRIEIELPDTFLFRTEIPVRISDINYGNHLGNDAVLSLMHEARLRFLAQYGFSEADIGGPGIIMTDAAVVYVSQAFYGDILAVDVTIAELHKYGFDLLYRLANTRTAKEVARGKTGMFCFDYGKKRIASVPQVFKDACGGTQSTEGK